MRDVYQPPGRSRLRIAIAAAAVLIGITGVLYLLLVVPAWYSGAQLEACPTDYAKGTHTRQHFALWPPGVECTHENKAGESVSQLKPDLPWLKWTTLGLLTSAAAILVVGLVAAIADARGALPRPGQSRGASSG